MATNGIVLLTPSSVAVTGGGSSATINTNGSVTFSACASLSLNDVFSSTYDNYVIDVRAVGTTLAVFEYRLRASGTDNTTINSYTHQYLFGSNTTVQGLRVTTNSAQVLPVSATQRDGSTIYCYGPALAQPTAVRSVTAYGEDGARIFDLASTHNQSTAYDGFTLFHGSQSFTGLIKVYGLVQ
jgi:hypothetical protein